MDRNANDCTVMVWYGNPEATGPSDGSKANECDYSEYGVHVGSAGHSNVRAAMKRNPRSALATTKTVEPRNRKTEKQRHSRNPKLLHDLLTSEILKPSALDPLQASAPVTQQ